jgi:hypothetical protein
MTRKTTVILPLATALASLVGAPTTAANAAAPTQSTAPERKPASTAIPNTFAVAGQDLLGFIVTEQADGTLVAQHASHASHASHRSHASHYSSR